MLIQNHVRNRYIYLYNISFKNQSKNNKLKFINKISSIKMNQLH